MPKHWMSTHYQRKRMSEGALFNAAKLVPDSGSADSLIQCSSKCKCFRTYSSADTVGYGAAQQMAYSCTSVDQASLSTTPTVGPGTLRLYHG